MTYFCFIESSILTVPYMEPLAAGDLDAAKEEAGVLLAVHTSGYAAHIIEDGERLATIRPTGRSGPASWFRQGPAT